MNRFINKITIVSATLLFICIFSLAASGASEFKAPNFQNPDFKGLSIQDYMNKDKKSGAVKLGKVAFIPFDYGAGIDELWAIRMYYGIAEVMQNSGAFEPYSIREWAYGKYMNNPASSVDRLVRDAANTGIPVDFICHGVVFRTGTDIGVKVTLYPLDNKIYRSHYIRYFYSPSGSEGSFNSNLGIIALQIVEEMKNRCRRENKFLFDKQIYIKNFNIKLLLYNRTPSGLEELTQVPFLNIKGVDYKHTDNFYSELLLYAFHASRLFDVRSSNMQDLVTENYDIPKDVDYVLHTDLLISEKMNTLSFKLVNNKTNEKVISYYYPFTSLNMAMLTDIMRQNANIISMSLLSSEDQKKVGTAEVVINDGLKTQSVYCNEYYLGLSDQRNLLLPFGDNDVRIENKMYKLFVLPYAQTGSYWKVDGSFMTQFINLLQ